MAASNKEILATTEGEGVAGGVERRTFDFDYSPSAAPPANIKGDCDFSFAISSKNSASEETNAKDLDAWLAETTVATAAAAYRPLTAPEKGTQNYPSSPPNTVAVAADEDPQRAAEEGTMTQLSTSGRENWSRSPSPSSPSSTATSATKVERGQSALGPPPTIEEGDAAQIIIQTQIHKMEDDFSVMTPETIFRETLTSRISQQASRRTNLASISERSTGDGSSGSGRQSSASSHHWTVEQAVPKRSIRLSWFNRYEGPLIISLLLIIAGMVAALLAVVVSQNRGDNDDGGTEISTPAVLGALQPGSRSPVDSPFTLTPALSPSLPLAELNFTSVSPSPSDAPSIAPPLPTPSTLLSQFPMDAASLVPSASAEPSSHPPTLKPMRMSVSSLPSDGPSPVPTQYNGPAWMASPEPSILPSQHITDAVSLVSSDASTSATSSLSSETTKPTPKVTYSKDQEFNLCFAIDMSGSVCNKVTGLECIECKTPLQSIFSDSLCRDDSVSEDICCNNFANVKEFSSLMVNTLDGLPGDKSFSVVQFATNAQLVSGLSSSTQILQAIDQLGYTGGRTNHGAAIQMCQENFTSLSDRKNIIMLITDGLSTEPASDPHGKAEKAATSAKSDGTFIVPVLVSPPNDLDALQFVRRLSSDEQVFHVTEFGSLDGLQDQLISQVLCS